MPGTLRDAPTALYRALLRADGVGVVPSAMEGSVKGIEQDRQDRQDVTDGWRGWPGLRRAA